MFYKRISIPLCDGHPKESFILHGYHGESRSKELYTKFKWNERKTNLIL